MACSELGSSERPLSGSNRQPHWRGLMSQSPPILHNGNILSSKQGNDKVWFTLSQVNGCGVQCIRLRHLQMLKWYKWHAFQNSIPSATCILHQSFMDPGLGVSITRTQRRMKTDPWHWQHRETGNLRRVPWLQYLTTFLCWLNGSLWTPSSPNKSCCPQISPPRETL